MQQQEFWRHGNQGGPFTVDEGGGGDSSTSATTPVSAANFASAFPLAMHPQPHPYLPLPSSSYPQQAPLDWASQQPLAHSYSDVSSPLAFNAYPSPFGPGAYPQSMPSIPFPGSFAHLAASSQQMDPNLFALHTSLEAQAAAHPRSSGAHDVPITSMAPPTSTVPMGGAGRGGKGGSSAPASGPVRSRKSASSFVNAARGAVTGSGGTTPRQHQSTTSSVPGSTHASPLPSPLGLPAHVAGDPASYFPTSHQRPLPTLPRTLNTTSAHSSAHPSPLGSPALPSQQPSRTPSTSSLALPNPLASPSLVSKASPHVDYDFSSLEEDLDRFGSGGGFASAAAAAMGSVGPNRRAHKGVGGYGVGGYGSPASYGVRGGDNAPSPKVVADVLGEEVDFPLRSPTASNVASPVDFSVFLANSPVGSATSGSGVGASGAGGVAGASTSNGGGVDAIDSPTGSSILDEEGAEALSRTDPIAAQVWRMFNKAKHTLPNGARMENLTWRLMSMTLKRRREEQAGEAAGSAAAAAGAEGKGTTLTPAEVEASFKSALEEELRVQQEKVDAKRKEEDAAREEERDNVQELRSRSGSVRGGRLPQVQAVVEADEEDRGRRRRTTAGGSGAGAGTKSASASESPEGLADDAMDWRAKSQSRSRSRAPEAMDWRAQSRSRSRAPAAVDATIATANFSRFYGDGSGSTTPSAATTNDATTVAAPSTSTASHASALSIADKSAYDQLAASLGLAPNPSTSYNSDHFDQAVMASFAAATSPPPPASFHSIGSPPTAAFAALSTAGSPGSLPAYVGSPGSFANVYNATSSSFAFGQLATSPEHAGGADPNLTAIENTLNQLINLQTLATNGGGSNGASPASNAASPAGVTKPTTSSAGTAVESFNSGRSAPNDYSFVQPSHSSKASQDSYASLAQQQLQQLASHTRRSSVKSPPSIATSPASLSSAYMNAAHLAQSSRPFAFSNTSPNASGISLGRPSTLVDPQSSLPPTPAAYFSQPPSPFGYPSSAPGPGHGFVGSPATSLHGDFGSMDPNQALYDYFAQSEPNSGYASPFLPSTSFDHSAPTHVNPSHLLAHLQQQTGHYDSDVSWGIVSPPSGNESSRTGTPSPPDPLPGTSAASSLLKAVGAPKGRKGSASSASMRLSASSPDLVGLGQALKGKAVSAPTSRVHSRSNTLSMPATVPEGKVAPSAEAPTPAVSSKPASKGTPKSKESPDSDNPTRCLNCSTTNTPLWRRDTDGRPLCNACGLFRNLHGVDRPANLNTGVIKKRNRARGKEGVPKKSGTSSRAAARRNSMGASPENGAAAVGRASAARTTGGAPYPSTASRSNSVNLHSNTASNANSPN